MSKPGIIYRLNWQSFHGSTDLQCYIDISDNDNLIPDDEDAQIISVTPAGEPARISVIDNNENPFTPILAQQLTINFVSTTQVNMSTFVMGSDQRFSVHYYLGSSTQTIFKGFLISDDNSISEDFLYPPNVVTLTANDGLPLLKDIPLVDADGGNPQGYHKISDYLSWALRKTGMDLSLFAAFNIKSINDISDISIPNSDPEHFFYVEYLEAKTFEDEIGSSIDCYEAIRRILGFEAKLFQYRGAWWILRVDEVEDATRGLFITEFDSSGSFVGNLGEFDFVKQIGTSNDIFFSDAATKVTATRANKSVRLNYNFETPLEVPCNIDFSRDDENPTIISPTQNHYTLECWDKFKSDGSATTTPVYLRRNYDGNGYETSRFVVIEQNSDFVYIQSEKIYVGLKDRFNLGVSMRMESDSGGSGPFNDFSVQVRLYGDNGTFWTYKPKWYNNDEQKWYQCTAAFNTFQKYYSWDSDFDRDQTEEVSLYDGQTIDIPAAGYIYIHIHSSQQFGTASDTYITSCTFDYIPYVNGSYQKYKGQYHTTNQTGNYKKKLEDQVYISDSPKKLFKGALFEFDGSAYNLSGLFYNAAVFPGGPPSSDYHHRYGKIQLFDVWNQYNRDMRVFQATCQGIDLDKTKTISGDSLPYPAHLINKWKLNDPTEHTNNKFFIALHFDQDHNTQGWWGSLRECVDTTINKDYSNHEFKYIT